MRWIYSDPHYYHNNVIKYCSRPFKDVEEMHEIMIKKHNEYISKHDKVFILGDISFGGKEDTAKIISQLQGSLVLIMGNHDRSKSRTWFLECGFDEVIKYPIILNNSIILSHEPLYLNAYMPYVNIHGHLHGNILLDSNAYKEIMTKWISKYDIKFNKYINVCLENNDFYPFSLDTLIEGIQEA